MTREQVKDVMYNIADAIKANADKYASGQQLHNDDWKPIACQLR